MSIAQAQTVVNEQPPVQEHLPGFTTALGAVLKRPQKFFEDFPAKPGYRAPLMFLSVAALFYAAVSYSYFFQGSMNMTVAVLINAMVMPFALAGVTWVVLTMSSGKVSYEKLIAMYAYASGAVMLFSWVPMVGYACEVWKAGLMACALAKGFDLGWKRGIVVVAATFLVVMLFIWSAMPVIQQLRGVVPA